MTCIDDGILRASLDGELAGTALAEVDQHLASCADCRARFQKLGAQTARTQDLLARLALAEDDPSINPALAYTEFSRQFGTVNEPKAAWITRFFAARWRPAFQAG